VPHHNRSSLTNERDFPNPRQARPIRVAVYDKEIPRGEVKIFHQLICIAEGEIMQIVTVGIDLAKNLLAM
jgi:hypothetical protein